MKITRDVFYAQYICQKSKLLVPAVYFANPFGLSNSEAKDSICNWAELEAVFASAAVLLHSEHSCRHYL